MLFPTVAFAIFFALVYPVNWLLAGRRRTWQWVMLLASYVFYGYWDWRFVGLIVLATAVNGFAAQGLAPLAGRRRRALLALTLAFDLGLLGWFKYYGFFAASLNEAAHQLDLPLRMPLLEILLPVGISFFTFQAMSYVVDVHRGEVEAVDLLSFSVYLAFFPQLVAGPIVRATEFLPQLKARRQLSPADASRAAWLICGGLFKKVVVSSYLATQLVDPVFGAPASFSAGHIWLAIYAYAVQIYADFSGYTDMAIGIALLLGFHFPQNFDRPYAATSLSDFWRRWHMTLSRWLRDYLYIPLGGSRQGRLRSYRNLVLTMLLGGLWHGAATTFVAWGLLHGIWLALERATREWMAARGGMAAREGMVTRRFIKPAALVGPAREASWSKLAPWAGRILTFHVVCLGWLLFRAESFAAAGTMLQRAFGAWEPVAELPLQGILVVAGMLLLQIMPEAPLVRLSAGFARLPSPLQGFAMGIFLFLITALGPEGVAPFIYFQF
jgi:D-alanyl-lipoteichoic acid acyltransferase DltB (MBOAT superfamily)